MPATQSRAVDEGTAGERTALPAWPITLLFGLVPVWWATGLFDIIWIIFAAAMAVLLARRGGVLAPRVLLIWFAFLGLMLASVSQLTRAGGSPVVFGYRALLYLSATVLLIYLFNAPEYVRRVAATRALVAYWIWTVVFGFLALVIPNARLQTPLYYLLSVIAPGSLSNSLVSQMAVRPFVQVPERNYLDMAPRPSAPFLYTNNWGSIYSLLLPIVIAYLVTCPRRTPSWWALTVGTIASLIPAFLTLNRGMFIGLGVAAAIVAVRLALYSNWKGIGIIALLGVVAGVAYLILPVQERLDVRLQGDGTSTRASIYEQSLVKAQESPLLGFGGTVPSEIPNEPPIGTQGQFWMLLVSHGYPATIIFIAFFLSVCWVTRRRADAMGLAMNTILVVAVIELLYYGVLPYGLPVMMAVAGITMRPTDRVDSG